MNYNNCLIDLHLHIDGALSVATAISLANMQEITLPVQDKKRLCRLLSAPENCKDLNEYLECFALPCSLMQTREAISEAIYRIQEEQKENGLIYAELRFAPQLHTEQGLSQEEVVKAAIDGLNRSDLKANLILCCMRGNSNFDANMETVRLADVYRNQGVAAVDLAGAEALYPTSNFKDIFLYAKELDVRFTIHAGEAAGADSVRTAIELGASRIGHGIHSITDTDLLEMLVQKQIPLELCITSNLQTKAVDKLENYPLRYFMKRGILVTLNTDNPSVSNTTMRNELTLAKQNFNLSENEIRQLLLNSAEASFADTKTKTDLKAQIKNAFQ